MLRYRVELICVACKAANMRERVGNILDGELIRVRVYKIEVAEGLGLNCRKYFHNSLQDGGERLITEEPALILQPYRQYEG